MKHRVKIAAVVIVLIMLSVQMGMAAEEQKVLELTIEDAVKMGLENSIQLEQVKNQINLNDLSLDRAEHISDEMEDADELLDIGWEQLNEAETAINNDIVPIDLPEYGIQRGTNLNDLVNAGIITEDKKDEIKAGINKELEKQKEKLESGELTLIDAVHEAGTTISEELDFSTLDALSLDSTRNLMTTMAEVSYEVAKASYDIYKNQIALLIQKSYYDALKAREILGVKQKAVERAEKQYQISKAAYEEGMKSKDELLLAELYYKKTLIERDKAQGDLENAVLELQKNMNISMDKTIKLKEVFADEITQYDIDKGLKQGLERRLEIKKALGEVIVYDLNFELTKNKYPSNTYQYREAKLLRQKARLNYNQTKVEVESSIRKSYQTLQTAASMLKKTKAMVEKAQEVVDIAQYKYNEGFGVPNSLLKKLDLESASGTIVEVLAAQENLAEVEEKVVEITHGYNLARMKYLNDIGEFQY